MNWLIRFYRSLSFSLFCWIFSISSGILLLPVVMFLPNTTKTISVWWARRVLWGLEFFCDIRYKVDESHNAKLHNSEDVQYVIVSKHQSTWETLFLTVYFNCPAFILKKELLYIPLFGLYLKFVNMIVIDRGSGVSAMRKIMREILQLKGSGRPIVIFPEGTRVLPGQRKKFQQGVMAIIKSIPNVVIIPVALNSGLYWPKGAWLKREGTIRVKFLPQISQKERREDLLEYLENEISEESDKFTISMRGS